MQGSTYCTPDVGIFIARVKVIKPWGRVAIGVQLLLPEWDQLLPGHFPSFTPNAVRVQPL
jgi:hypothetical protein